MKIVDQFLFFAAIESMNRATAMKRLWPWIDSMELRRGYRRRPGLHKASAKVPSSSARSSASPRILILDSSPSTASTRIENIVPRGGFLTTFKKQAGLSSSRRASSSRLSASASASRFSTARRSFSDSEGQGGQTLLPRPRAAAAARRARARAQRIHQVVKNREPGADRRGAGVAMDSKLLAVPSSANTSSRCGEGGLRRDLPDPDAAPRRDSVRQVASAKTSSPRARVAVVDLSGRLYEPLRGRVQGPAVRRRGREEREKDWKAPRVGGRTRGN